MTWGGMYCMALRSEIRDFRDVARSLQSRNAPFY